MTVVEDSYYKYNCLRLSRGKKVSVKYVSCWYS
jgi:hypothetical protein